MPPTRQLAAIMFADIAGYTALMGSDESLAMQFRDRMKQKLESELKIHKGKLIKLSGDGAICSFESAIEAVRAAIALQLSMLEEPKIPVRIGIHQADVIFEKNDVHGDGVNIASRLESFAIPGSIFVSAKVYDELKNQKDIQTVSLGKYQFKNVHEPVEIYAINNPGLQVPLNKKLEGKGIKYTSKKFSIGKKTLLTRAALVIIALGLAGYMIVPRMLKKQNARHKLLPAIQKMVDENFRPPIEAFEMALKAEKSIPGDCTLVRLLSKVATRISIESVPEGAEVFWKDYTNIESDWRKAGTTPLYNERFPRTYLRIEIRKKGFQTIEYAVLWPYKVTATDTTRFKLDESSALPENMVRIPKNTTPMYIVGLEQHGGKVVEEFLMDKYEVTNKQFKAFIDAGGYTNKTNWNEPVYSNGKEISLESALPLFTDKTGRPGPANWEAGTYPDGQENHPVTGISWYEAAAYAAFVKKQLPTVFHWAVVAATGRTEDIVPFSNFSGKSAVGVGSKQGISTYGVYDLAGNAREWCYNESNIPGLRFILGGGWNDPSYAFNDSYTQQVLDRGIANGFRCMKELPGDSGLAMLMKDVDVAHRDYRKEKPVDDKTFAIFLNQYSYDKTPLEPKIEESFDNESWKAEKISFDAGYNNERMEAYLYLPKNFQPPYQTVIFFPGSGDIFSKKFDTLAGISRLDFLLKSGRAVVYPILKGTHERHDELVSDLQEPTVFYKDHVIMWRKDLGRTIDYLETRKDIQADKISFLGWSWGGFMGGIYAAIEKRFKVIVLNVGGMEMHKALPEADQFNFLTRVTQPVLMLNGKHDMFFPVETAQKPMFDFLGTPKADKKIIIYESGHLVPRTDFVKETLAWLDKYLGVVK